LEFYIDRLKAFEKKVLLSAVWQVILTPIIVALGFYLFQFSFEVSLVIGLMLTLSSTASVLRILTDQAELDSLHGRGAFALLLIQDIAVVFFAVFVSLLGTSREPSAAIEHTVRILGGASLLVFSLYIILSKVAVRAISTFNREKNRELTLLLTIVTGIGATALAHQVGISPAMGAFVAGMALGGSPFAAQIRSDIAPLRALLLTLFFASAGMIADPVAIFQNVHILLPFCIAIILGKTLLTSTIFSFSNSLSAAVAIGVATAQVSEFAFVLGKIARENGVLSDAVYQNLVACTIITLLLSPPLVEWGPAIGLKVQKWLNRLRKVDGTSQLHEAVGKTAQDFTCFVLGFGPAGQEIARELSLQGEKVAVIDLNEKAIRVAAELNVTCFIGDIRQFEVMEHFKVSKAKLVVITIPGIEAAMQALHTLRRLSPQTIVLMRSRHQIFKQRFLNAGAYDVVSDEEAVGRRLQELSLMYLQESDRKARLLEPANL
jgi:CPA2 family monovalent cation:H+ antiporter-2